MHVSNIHYSVLIGIFTYGYDYGPQLSEFSDASKQMGKPILGINIKQVVAIYPTGKVTMFSMVLCLILIKILPGMSQTLSFKALTVLTLNYINKMCGSKNSSIFLPYIIG